MSGFGFGARSGLHRNTGRSSAPRITISGIAISEAAPAGSIVGALSVFAGSGTYSYSIPAGGDPDGVFAIAGANLVTSSVLDFEASRFHQVTIEADNGVDPALSRSLIISVTNAFEQPDLRALSLPSIITQGSVVSISGATAGSSISAPQLPAGWTLDPASLQIAIANDAPPGAQSWTLVETLADSANSPNASNGTSSVEMPAVADILAPSNAWDGTAGSGFTSAPVDPARMTAKPVLRLIEPAHQHFTDTLTIGAQAMANNKGTLIDGVAAVRFYFENDAPVEVAEPTFRTLTREDGSTYGCLGYWADLQKPASREGAGELYIEAVPSDATMQSRVIGPFLYYPVATLHDWVATVGTGGDFSTFRQARDAARNAGASNGLIELLDGGDYTVTQGGAPFVPTGYLTVRPASGVTARLTLGAGNENVWDTNVGRFWFEEVDFDLDTIAAIKTQNDGGHVFRRCRMERTGGRQLWFKNTPPLSYFAEGPACLLECYSDGIYEPGDRNEMMRGNIMERGFGDITASCPATLYNTFHEWDWLDIAPTDTGRMRIAYSGAGSSVTLARSYQSSGPQTNRYRIFTLKVDGVTALTFEAWQFWDRFAEPVTNDGATPATVRGYEVQHFVDAINALPDFTATVLDNDLAARALNLQGSTDNADFGDTQIIAGTGSYDVIADIDLHGGAISGVTGENYLHLFDRYTEFNEDLLWNYSDNPGYNDVVIAGCILDQGNDAFTGMNNLIADAYSHVVFAHNSMRGQRATLGRSNGTTTWDSYCLVSNNAAPRLADNSPSSNIFGANNHLEDGVGLSPNFTGTLVSGTTASWFPQASGQDFGVSGELEANPKPPVMTYDMGGNIRANPSPVGASSQIAAAAQELPFVVVGLLGQSNVAGTAPADAQDIDVENIWQFASSPIDAGTFDQIISDITPLLHPRSAAPEERLGTGDYFARQIMANGLVPDGYRLLIVPCARGATGMITGGQEWKPTAPLGTLLQGAIDQCTKAVNAAQALNSDSHFAGFLWGQGENEVNNSGGEDAYVAAFTQLVDQVRTSVPTATDCWAMLGSMVPEWTKGQANGQAIQSAHMRLALGDDRIHFDQAPTGLADPGGPIHYGAAGFRTYGARLGDALPSAIADPRLTYGFAGDEIGDGSATPILAMTNAGSVDLIIRNGAGVGLGAKCLSAAGSSTLSTLSSAGAVFDGVGDQSDICVEWTANFSGRASMVLRAQINQPYNATLGYPGYLFRVDESAGLSVFRIDPDPSVNLLGSHTSVGSPTNPRLRASVIGNRLTFAISSDGGASWTTVIDEFDDVFASGGAAYMQGGAGTRGGEVIAENFVFRRRIPA